MCGLRGPMANYDYYVMNMYVYCTYLLFDQRVMTTFPRTYFNFIVSDWQPVIQGEILNIDLDVSVLEIKTTSTDSEDKIDIWVINSDDENLREYFEWGMASPILETSCHAQSDRDLHFHRVIQILYYRVGQN